MDSKIDPAELQTTNDLLRDFSADPDLSPEEVYRTSWSRFNILEQVPLHEILQEKRISRILRTPIYIKLPIAFHKFIYDGLYTFAGKFRSKDDPHGGNIFLATNTHNAEGPDLMEIRPTKSKKVLLKLCGF